MFLKVKTLLISQGFISNVIFTVIKTAVDNVIKISTLKRGIFKVYPCSWPASYFCLAPCTKETNKFSWFAVQFGMELMQ